MGQKLVTGRQRARAAMAHLEEERRAQLEKQEAALTSYFEAEAAETAAQAKLVEARQEKNEAVQLLRKLGKTPTEIGKLTGLGLGEVRVLLRGHKPETAGATEETTAQQAATDGTEAG